MNRKAAIKEIEEVMLEIGSVMRNLHELRQTSNRNEPYYSGNYSMEANELAGMDIEFLDAVTHLIVNNELELLNSEGLREILSCCREIAEKYGLKVQTKENEEHEAELSEDSWKVYLDNEEKIKKVEYGSNKTEVQLVYSDGTISNIIEMAGKDYEGKDFAKKLLTAAEIENTAVKDLELQDLMLDDGLFNINEEEGWIEKKKYFERMTAKDFLTIQDYKDVTVKAVYDDSKGKLTFTYTVGGKTENLFVINASNNQKERSYPTASGTNVFPSNAATKEEREKIQMKTIEEAGLIGIAFEEVPVE